MTGLPENTLETIKRYLLRQQKEVEGNLKDIQKDDPADATTKLAETSEPGTDSWVADNHVSSVAIGSELSSFGSKVKKALYKIKDRTYGKCEKCGNQIEIGRLLAMPTAEYCLSCSSKIKK